jgi:hypothetical protein
MAQRRSGQRRPEPREASPLPADSATRGGGDAERRVTGLLWVLAALGIVATFGVSLCSWGTNDTLSFARFANGLERDGLLATYRHDPLFNHPPLVSLWCRAALAAAGDSALAFAVVFRIPIVLAGGACALLLARIARLRGASPRAAAAMAASVAWNPCLILVAGYHCNTDPLYATLSLLAVHLLQDRRRPLLAGLALGLAINVKLIPVLLIVPLALTLRSWRDLFAFAGGLALMALPFLPPLLMEPAFARNVLHYRSQLDNWGVPYLLAQATTGDLSPRGEPTGNDLPSLYFRTGSALVLAAVLGWAALARRLNRWDAYRVAAVTFALFLVLTPGFGVQYLVIAVPFLYATTTRAFANAYGLLAGLFLLATYWMFWDGGFPLSSLLNSRFPAPLAVLGLLPWGLLVYFLAVVAPRRTARPAA